MLFANDIVLCSTGRDEVEKKLEHWRRPMEDRGPTINRQNTVYLRLNGDGNLNAKGRKLGKNE